MLQLTYNDLSDLYDSMKSAKNSLPCDREVTLIVQSKYGLDENYFSLIFAGCKKFHYNLLNLMTTTTNINLSLQ